MQVVKRAGRQLHLLDTYGENKDGRYKDRFSEDLDWVLLLELSGLDEHGIAVGAGVVRSVSR